ncbi:MAG TPA: metallophosphoesterase [Bryobacteraceae bacterium]|jgi:3',5'-cyclic AMP phosphodiesterase CpdA|nr:metallophosphoesterase [Bryobacteraceae bacterium]
MDRRQFLLTAAATPALAAAAPGDFTFVHLTDTHIQPEQRAAEGCRACFRQVNAVKPEFILIGGDLVFDAADVPPQRAKVVYDLYRESVKLIEAPTHAVIGNHDVFCVTTKSGGTPDTPGYGKRMFEDHVGKRYYSFTHKGWQFLALDSIHLTSNDRFIGRIDDDQLTWLKNTLAAVDRTTPLVVLTHIPLVTGFLHFASSPATPDMLVVTNAREVLNLLWPYNLKAVLQGHTHVRETVLYNGCQFITSGAVCGNWWRGPRLGHPEGFGVLTARNGELAWRYQEYGFKAAV